MRVPVAPAEGDRIMKGTFFGYVAEEPCPYCKAPRVGRDYDDDYYIAAGVLHPAVPATCNFKGWIPQGGEWYGYYRSGREIKYVSSKTEPTTCPCCGGQVKEGTVDIPYYDRLRRPQVQHVRAWICENTQTEPSFVEDVKGCQHCGETHSI